MSMDDSEKISRGHLARDQIRVFSQLPHGYCPRRSIDRDRSSMSPADPSKFLTRLSLGTPGAPSSAGFLDICEPPHVWMSRRNGAANPECRELHESRAEKVSLVYVNVTGQNPPGVRGSTTSKRGRERASGNERARRAGPSRAYAIIAAAHVTSRISRPRIPFSILAKVAAGHRPARVLREIRERSLGHRGKETFGSLLPREGYKKIRFSEEKPDNT